MSLTSNFELSWWQKVLLRIVACGPGINHLAVVMDGNRRFAQKFQQKPVFGHDKGAKNIINVFEMVRLIGVKELTVYAFSVENFKRSKDELDDLKKLAMESMRKVHENIEILHTKGIRIRFLGELHMMDEDMQEFFGLITEATKANTDFICNIAVAYTSQIEITRAIKCVLGKIQDHELLSEEVNENVLERFFYNPEGRPVDLWIRTSGETRFSDFLTWRSDSAIIYFTSTLWPEFGIFNFLRAVMQYQRIKLQR